MGEVSPATFTKSKFHFVRASLLSSINWQRQLLVCAVLIVQLSVSVSVLAQQPASTTKDYASERKRIANSISNYIYGDFAAFNSAAEDLFVQRLDSLEKLLTDHLDAYSDELDVPTVLNQRLEVRFFFDRLLLEYPAHHHTYTGRHSELSESNRNRLTRHYASFNDTSLLGNTNYLDYVQAYLEREKTEAMESGAFAGQDNRWLLITMGLIDEHIQNPIARTYWKHHYLYRHIDDLGIKNIDSIYQDFMRSCDDSTYTDELSQMYNSHQTERSDHPIVTYKSVDGYALDLHLFLPDSVDSPAGTPLIIYFHGGSWTTGKPDYFFNEARSYVGRGWAAAAVEYRLGARHGTLPFAAVQDARSAIRWVRQHADRYRIDTTRILATGNSAGGHLVLTSALANEVNESTDDISVSPTPNALLVTSGVFDLTVENTQWITRAAGADQDVKSISPNHLLRPGLPPTLIVHGTEDRNCPYPTAQHFVTEMESLGNSVTFHPVQSGGHFIWFGPFAGEVGRVRSEYISSLLSE